MKIKRILIDLDDVLNQFTMAALGEVGCPAGMEDLHLFDPKWGYDIVYAASKLHPSLIFSPDMFWGMLSDYFWRNVPISVTMFPIIEACANIVGREQMCILTAPTRRPGVAAAKIAWMNEYLPSWISGRYIISRHKHFCAHPEALLIDDCEENVRMFRRHMGHAILVPRPWNSLHANTSDALQYVLLELERTL